MNEPFTIRFWINGKEYLAPRDWIAHAMTGGIKSGLSPNAAFIQAAQWWQKQAQA